MGVESDESVKLSASDSHTEITSANYGRLNTQTGGGAWCIGVVTPGDRNQYLQIDLGRTARIEGIIVQGRFNGTEGAEKLAISVLRDEWLTIDEIGGTSEGTENYTIDPIVARVIRLHPLTSRSRPVCLRVELVGCYMADNDDFKSYRLSIPPNGNIDERGLINLQGQGRLSDRVMDKYLRFNGDLLAVTLEWHVPINLTGKLFIISS